MDVSLGEDASQLSLATESMQDGIIRILGTSYSDVVVSGHSPQLLKFKVKSNRAIPEDSRIEFSNILFAERDLTGHYYDGYSIEYVEPSSVYELMEEARIYVENGNIIVDTPVNGTVQLIAVDGRMAEYPAYVGHNVYKVGVNGIFMIHFNGKTLKVRL